MTDTDLITLPRALINGSVYRYLGRDETVDRLPMKHGRFYHVRLRRVGDNGWLWMIVTERAFRSRQTPIPYSSLELFEKYWEHIG